jgi:hypothetical protein
VLNAAMHRRFAPAALLAGLLATGPAAAFEPAEIEAAAAVARIVEPDVRWLAADELEGRGSGTAAADAAAELLIDQLAAIGPGLDPIAPDREAYRQRFDGVRSNLLAVIPGGALADEFVLVGAHYDHLTPAQCPSVGDPICNGATDNAAGVAAVLAIGRALRALPNPPARSVVLALWDGEEIGLLGSKYFAANPLVPLADVVTYVNFDIQGANLAPSLRSLSFAIGAETGGALLTALTQSAIDAVGLDTKPLSLTFGQGRSDYLPIVAAQIPVVFFTDATNACYHTSGDDVAVADFGKLARQSEIGFRLTLAVAESEERPPITGQVALDTFEDLVVLSDLLTLALADYDSVLPSYQSQLVALEELARSRVAEGPEEFAATEALSIALPAIDLTTYGFPCDPLLLPEPDGGAAVALAALGLAAVRSRSR